MKHLLVTGYIFVLALFTMAGAFMAFGAPFNDKVAVAMCFGGGYICFERLCKMCGIYE
ncbi:sliding clamp [Escherichia phage vB_EcoM_ESCO10]|nr:sliding clamp [Escherichia phage vB_EcoM_ESCO10]